MATKKGLEPSTSSVTGWRSNQLNYLAMLRSRELKLAYYSKCRGECQHPFSVFCKKFRAAHGKPCDLRATNRIVNGGLLC